MTILVVGASGATGRLLVEQLVTWEQTVKVVVRTPEKLPEWFKGHDRISVIQASVLDLSDADMVQHAKGCDAVASCLGHNISLKGIYGQPRRLVADATRRLCNAIKAGAPTKPIRFVLMNTAGNSNRDLHEPESLAQRCAIGLIRLLLPPQVDNERAADHLRTQIGQSDGMIEWAVVRPVTLINATQVSEYEAFPSPTRSVIVNSGVTSRINVAHFMARLMIEETTWNKWRGQMPVIYNKATS